MQRKRTKKIGDYSVVHLEILMVYCEYGYGLTQEAVPEKVLSFAERC
jgi:hypothetical protein